MGGGRGRHQLLHTTGRRERDRLAWRQVRDAARRDQLRGTTRNDAVCGRAPQDRDMDRRVGRVEAGPTGAGVEVLIDEAVVESGQRHALRAPLPEPHPVAPTMTAEAHRSRWRRRRTGCSVRCAGAAEGRERSLRLIVVERRLERAALSLKAGEPDQRLSSQAVELAVITGDRCHLAGDRVRPRLQRIQ